MRLLVVSDLHGSSERLGRFLRHDDLLLSLGDHINVIDYKDLSGVLAEFVPRETIESTLATIQSGDLADARRRMAMAAGSVPNLFRQIRLTAEKAYDAMSRAIPCPGYFIYGNVDFPEALAPNLGDDHHLCLAEKLEIAGRRVGLVSGHPPGPYSFGMPGEIPATEFSRRLHEVGAVEILGIHSPPPIPGLTYDVTAERDEGGSADLLYYCRLHRPRLVLFGHVHQPQLAEFVDVEVADEPIRYLNVGCFRDTHRLLEIEPRTLETRWLTAD